ncbi:MAG: nucleotidyltransferase family protein [Microcoleus sp. CSU_2_2]|nr:nucleotidyltransferase family protein [Microcoleus sp. SU_5_3]NJS09434.1 nucleotidyltransferase family protein [Microcoleus sp. CSU_2_2]
MLQTIPKISIKPGYCPQSEDKTPEADAIDFYRLRQLTNSQRWQIGAKLTRWAKTLSLRGMRKACPSNYQEKFARSILGSKWLPILTPTNDSSMWIQDPSEIARLLHPIFATLNIPYYITGGVAASIYGDPRTTRDLDLVIELNRDSIAGLVEVLETAGFYCPPGAVEDMQNGRGRVLSVTHMTFVLNADMMLNADTEFDRSKMARRRLEALDEAGIEQFWIAAAEDIVLSKLLWRKQSRSQKQWIDVLGIMKVQSDHLDRDYLTEWAEELGLIDDLNLAFVEAGI